MHHRLRGLEIGRTRRLAVAGLLVALVGNLEVTSEALAQAGSPPPPVALTAGPDRHMPVYRLETVEIRGTDRMTAQQLTSELSLTPGTPLGDDMVMTTRTRLLGLGLFKSAILLMRRGSKPGYARLIVEVEDDDSVLTSWALGGELGVTITDTSYGGPVPAGDPNSAPADYRLQLVGRNLFNAMHRGSVMADIDAAGNLRAGQIAYGLPRFAVEQAQFDAELAVADPYYRYLDTLGFGGRGQGLWSGPLGGVADLQYGAAMYVNKGPDFDVKGFPKAVAGPKVAYYRETRLRGFFPGDGYQLGASLVLTPIDTQNSVLEASAERTFNFSNLLYMTGGVKGLTVGDRAYSVRAEGRVEAPLGGAEANEDQAEVFLRLRGGHDWSSTTSLEGSDAIIGVRYHSNGFIAELAFKVTRSPEQLAPHKLSTKSLEDAP